MTDVLWMPPEELSASSAMAEFARENNFDPSDYDSLHRWSIGEPGAFWSAVWDRAGIIAERGETALATDESHPMTEAAFFPEARLNLGENLLRQKGGHVAVIETDETGNRREITADALRFEVARVAAGMRADGIRPGDRVAVILPNRLDCLVTFLATAAIGAVWTSCSPDFGTSAILDRMGQVRPRLLIAQAQIRYGGKDIDISDRIGEIAAQLDGLERLILVGDNTVIAPVPTTGYSDFGAPADLEFTRVGFNDPAYILYTSGTTGAPKAIVHRTGGVLMQKVKEHMLHGDVRPGDRVLWYTNTAWMMYHWVTGVLACDATLVLYDGAPILKTADGELDGSPLWRVAERERLTHLGISPKYLATLSDSGSIPKEHFDLSSLRWLLSAGFASISGGTEIMGCFLLGSPLHPVRRGRLTVKGLGMAVNVMDDRNAPVVGRAGDLVCTEPFPSMPLTFWGEGGEKRYRTTYFSDRTEIWTHGDLATLHFDGSAVIHGRSDCTLNPGGVRIGTADIYNVCERFAELEDCLVFGRPVPGDEEIVLCLKLAAGHAVSPDLAKAIRTNIRSECSPRHVPTAIYVVTDIPYTLNGKRVEGAVRAMVSGLDVRNKASLANASCLEEYGELAGREAL